jgi:hypothetical protein
MAAQIDRLLAALDLGAIRFGIVPLDVQVPVVAMNGFWILDDQILAETINAEITIRDPDDVALHERLIDELWSVATEGGEARELLGRIAATLTLHR